MGEKSLVKNQPKPVATFSLVIGVLMAVVGSSFQYGYNIAVVNAPADEIQVFYFGSAETCKLVNQTSQTFVNSTTGAPPAVSKEVCETDNDHAVYSQNMYAIPVAAFAAAGMVGSLLVGPVVGKFGRRGGLMVNNIISFIAALCLGIAKPAGSFSLIVIGRIFIGVFAGLATGIVPMYIGEISPKEWRGAIGVLNQLLITIGILVAQLFGLQKVLGTETLWPYLLAFTCIPSIMQMISIPFMPKSPRFLLIDQGKDDEAKKVLIKLRGTENVEAEMDEMKAEASAQEADGQMTILELFKDKTVRWQLITVLLMMAAQQLSGINAVFFYTNLIFDKAGIPRGNQQDLASVGVGSVNVLMTIISVAIIELVGRKKLIVYGFGMMIFWCAAMTVVLNLLIAFNTTWISYLSIACVIGYIVGFAIGPGPIPWLITAELFRQAARPPAFMVACLLNWTCNFIIGISFPAVSKATGPYVFILFMLVCIAITAFLSVVMPETKGKSFQEISNLFAKRNKVPINSGSSREEENAQKIPLTNMSQTDQV